MATFTSDNQQRAEQEHWQAEQELAATMTLQNYQRLLTMTLEQVSYLQNEVQQLRTHNQALEGAVNKQAKQAFQDKDDLRYFLAHAQQQNAFFQAQIQILKGMIHAREVTILTLQQEKNALEQQGLALKQQLESESKHHYHEKSDFIQALEQKVDKIDDLRQQLRYHEQEQREQGMTQQALQAANEKLLQEIAQLHEEVQKQVLEHWHEQMADQQAAKVSKNDEF